MDKQVQRKPKEEDEEDAPETETVSRVEERKIPVEVYLCKEMDEVKTPPHPVDKVWFEVQCRFKKEYGIEFTIDGPDIACLKDEAWSRLDKRFEIKWFEYYLVNICPARIYEGQGEGLELSYTSVWKGITWEGRELLKEYRRGRDYDDNYRISPWPGKFVRRNGDIQACIPENEMTKTALEEFCAKIAKVREALEAMVTPEVIMATLTNISGLKLLQASNDQVAAEQQTKNERQKENTSNRD